jgi:hypothetical protein
MERRRPGSAHTGSGPGGDVGPESHDGGPARERDGKVRGLISVRDTSRASDDEGLGNPTMGPIQSRKGPEQKAARGGYREACCAHCGKPDLAFSSHLLNSVPRRWCGIALWLTRIGLSKSNMVVSLGAGFALVLALGAS